MCAPGESKHYFQLACVTPTAVYFNDFAPCHSTYLQWSIQSVAVWLGPLAHVTMSRRSKASSSASTQVDLPLCLCFRMRGSSRIRSLPSPSWWSSVWTTSWQRTAPACCQSWAWRLLPTSPNRSDRHHPAPHTYWAQNSGFDLYLLPRLWVETWPQHFGTPLEFFNACRLKVASSTLRWKLTNFLWTTWLAQRVTNQAGSSTIAKLQRAGDSSCNYN